VRDRIPLNPIVLAALNPTCTSENVFINRRGIIDRFNRVKFVPGGITPFVHTWRILEIGF
jgi:hypothetical protein